MALDYLIAFRLLAGDTEGFVRLIGTMAEAGMTRLPRHCQEAVLVHVARTGSDVDLHGLVVDPATATRFAGFLEALGRYVEEPEVLSRTMDEQFGDSYFHYYYGGGYELSEEARP